MAQNPIEFLHSRQQRKDVVDFRAGDTVRVHWKVKEGEKERVQPFEGVVIRKKEGQTHATFTVRKMSYGVGVERIFPLHSPRYERIEILTKGAVNRARLFYLRNLKGKASRIESQEELEAEAPAPAKAEAAPAEKPAEVPAAEKPAKAPKAPKAKKEAKAK